MNTAEQIAMEGPYTADPSVLIEGWLQLRDPDGKAVLTVMEPHDAHETLVALNASYTRGQQDRWIPVAMIHNDYDCSVRCSNCGDAGGFGVYDDLEWAKHCPGCGRPISEQVDAKGVRTPHPLYPPPNPEQRCGSEQ